MPDPLPDITRPVAASTRGKLLLGHSFRKPLEHPKWWQKLLGIKYLRGSYFQFEPLDRATALTLFDTVLATRGVFYIETPSAGEGTMDFHLRNGRDAWIDCWFFDCGLNEVSVTNAGARRLVELLYTDCSEEDILQFLKSEGADIVFD